MNVFEMIEKTPLFEHIKGEDMESVLGCLGAEEKTYVRGEYVYTTGDVVHRVGIVLSGSVTIIKEDFWGNRAVMGKMGAGDMFGEVFACAEIPILPVSAVTAEDSRILFIDYGRILRVCSSVCEFHTVLIGNMLKILAEKNLMLTAKIEHMAKPTTREKLLSYLSAQAAKERSNCFEIPFNRQELADYLSVDRSAMSNELSKLRGEGILDFQKNKFVLT